MAWSVEPWILEGAAVQVSTVGFDDGRQQTRILNEEAVSTINADLTSSVDVSKARVLKENQGIPSALYLAPEPVDRHHV